MEEPKNSNDEISTDLEKSAESAIPSVVQIDGQTVAENVSKFLFKATRKVGYMAYDLVTDAMLDNANKMREMSGYQTSHRLSDLSNEELIRRAQSATSSNERNAIMKELSERRDASKSESYSRMENYGETRVWDYVGKYETEDKNVLIYVRGCTDVKMEFVLAVINPPKRAIECTGKFLGKKRVLYTGSGCTVMIKWNSMDDFVLKGKVPWEKEEVELLFTRSV